MRKILVVDDDRDIILLVSNRLKNSGYAVVTASGGSDGVKKAVEEQPNVIIMDVMMPDMDGGEAVKALQSMEATKNIPVIFLTAIATASPDRSINVQGKLYPALGKPFDPKELLSCIKSIMGE